MQLTNKIVLYSLLAAIIAALLSSGLAYFLYNTSFLAIMGIAVVSTLITAGCCSFFVIRGIAQPVSRACSIVEQASQGMAVKNISSTDDALPKLNQAVLSIVSVLKKERGLARGILKGLPMPYLLVDTKERTVSTNKECLTMLEIDDDVEHCLGKTLAELFYNDPTRETAVGRSMATGSFFANLDVTITGHKGRITHVLANVFPIYDEDMSCLGGLCLYVDMTRLKNAEKQIEAKNEKMVLAARRLEESARSIAEYSLSLGEAIHKSNASTGQAAFKLSNTTQAMNQMNASVQNVAQSAVTASQASTETREKAQNGASIVEQSLHSIEGVRQISMKLREDMHQLNDHAQNITQIMAVISDIADQTNLLALNAAIEAARAGEAGRGFAVVADEVRKLAEKTMDSTTDVHNAIHAIQVSTEKSVSSMDSAMEQVVQATDLANQSGTALTEIVATVDTTANQVKAIALASDEQSQASKAITSDLVHVDTMVKQSAEAMEEANRAIQDLAKQVQSLEELVRELEHD